MSNETDKWIDWPDEPGWYWFYGHRKGSVSVDLFPAQAHITDNSGTIVVTKINEFMYKSEWAGKFALAILPNIRE
jgi:hypothetical protein